MQAPTKSAKQYKGALPVEVQPYPEHKWTGASPAETDGGTSVDSYRTDESVTHRQK